MQRSFEVVVSRPRWASNMDFTRDLPCYAMLQSQVLSTKPAYYPPFQAATAAPPAPAIGTDLLQTIFDLCTLYQTRSAPPTFISLLAVSDASHHTLISDPFIRTRCPSCTHTTRFKPSVPHTVVLIEQQQECRRSPAYSEPNQE